MQILKIQPVNIMNYIYKYIQVQVEKLKTNYFADSVEKGKGGQIVYKLRMIFTNKSKNDSCLKCF